MAKVCFILMGYLRSQRRLMHCIINCIVVICQVVMSDNQAVWICCWCRFCNLSDLNFIFHLAIDIFIALIEDYKEWLQLVVVLCKLSCMIHQKSFFLPISAPNGPHKLFESLGETRHYILNCFTCNHHVDATLHVCLIIEELNFILFYFYLLIYFILFIFICFIYLFIIYLLFIYICILFIYIFFCHLFNWIMDIHYPNKKFSTWEVFQR